MLDFAVIGVGRMGKRHAFNLAHGFLRGVRLKAVCDISPDALKWCEKHCKKAARYSDFKEMAKKEKLDGVIIATPHYSHAEIAEYMINNGVNTLVEKPLAPNVMLVKRVCDAARLHPDIKVGVSYNQRSNKMYIKARSLLSSGQLGAIQRVNFIITDWYRSQAYYDQGGWRASYAGEGGGCLMNQCIHQLDILCWLVGMPKRVTAVTHTKDRNITVENDVAAILEYDGFDCAFTASTHEIKGVNRLEISCDKGRIVITPLKMTIYRHKSENLVNSTTLKGYGYTPTRRSFSGYGIRLVGDIVKGQQLRSLRAFRNAICGKGDMLAEACEGENAIQVINSIYLSAHYGRSVELPVDPDEYGRYLDEMIALEKR